MKVGLIMLHVNAKSDLNHKNGFYFKDVRTCGLTLTKLNRLYKQKSCIFVHLIVTIAFITYGK